MKKTVIILSMLSFFLIVSNERVFSQGLPPDPGCPTPPCPAIPLDGGISLLIAAGIAYGSKKVYNAKKK